MATEIATAQILGSVFDEVKKLTETAQLTEDGKLFAYGEDVSWFLEIKQEYSRTHSWRRSATGKLRVTAGDYGNRQSYPQRKDGHFAYDKIAAQLHAIAWTNAGLKKNAQIRAAHSDVALGVKINLGIADYSGIVSASTNPEKPVTLNIPVRGNFTAEEAVKVVETLRSLGIKVG